MKQGISILFVLTIGLTTFGQGDSMPEKQFTLKGRIIEKVKLTPDCGVIAWGTVVRFEIIQISGINYQNKSIGIIITCPEIYSRNFFKKGKNYQVVFSNKNQASFGWTIPNKSLLSKNNLAFEPYAITVTKLP